jgi:hypothetical protein
VNAISQRVKFGIVSHAIDLTKNRSSGELSYIWQLYFPRLPGMTNDFQGIFSPFQIWFKGLVGRYNWLETVFPNWVYYVALVPAGAIATLCVRELYTLRSSLRARLGELGVYAAMTLGIMMLVGGDSYFTFPTLDAGVSEPRYMMPMLALGAAALALAARGAGRRWGPSAGTLIVLVILAHDIFSQLLVISRYYG